MSALAKLIAAAKRVRVAEDAEYHWKRPEPEDYEETRRYLSRVQRSRDDVRGEAERARVELEDAARDDAIDDALREIEANLAILRAAQLAVSSSHPNTSTALGIVLARIGAELGIATGER